MLAFAQKGDRLTLRGFPGMAVALPSVVVDLDQVRELGLGTAEIALNATSPKSRLTGRRFRFFSGTVGRR